MRPWNGGGEGGGGSGAKIERKTVRKTQKTS